MITETELETRLRIAEARLGVAEELRWLIVPLAGVAVHQHWHLWPLSIAVASIVVFVVPHPFSKEYDKAQEQYEKFTGTGKYWRPKEPNQPPQRNAGSRPSSDDSPASETPSSLGPRG